MSASRVMGALRPVAARMGARAVASRSMMSAAMCATPRVRVAPAGLQQQARLFSDEVNARPTASDEAGAEAQAEGEQAAGEEERIDSLENIRRAREEGRVVVLKNIAYDSSPEDVAELMSPYGEVEYLILPRRSPGLSFVHFASASDAKNAVDAVSATVWRGRFIRAEIGEREARAAKPNNFENGPQTPTKFLCVRNLPFDATDKDFTQLLRPIVGVKTIRIPRETDGRHRGYMHVHFDSVEAASEAREQLYEHEMLGRKLFVLFDDGPRTDGGSRRNDRRRNDRDQYNGGQNNNSNYNNNNYNTNNRLYRGGNM